MMAMAPVVGRRHEQGLLQKILGSRQSEFVAIYGRRRVGKTFLVRETCQNKGSYLEVTGIKNAPKKEQMRNFAEAFGKVFFDNIQVATPKDWREAFTHLKQVIEKRKNKKKFILFFDELPWLATRKSGFLNVLDHFWNTWASLRQDIVLIVCGSAASWMLEKIIHGKGGLYNRLTQIIRLLPFDLEETRQLLQTQGIFFTEKDILEIYMALGGIPHYLSQIEKGQSVAQNINRLCFQKNGALFAEFETLYASLFENSEDYIRVVKALAGSRNGLTRDKLLKVSGLKTGGGAKKIFTSLEEAGFIACMIPYGKKSNQQIYRLIDEYSYFYLKWIIKAPRGIFAEKNTNDWLMKANSPAWKSWAGFAFEGICLKHIHQIKKGLGISGVSSHNAMWRYFPKKKTEHGVQIDLLIDRMDQIISICEIKFSQDVFVITKKDAEELKRKIQVFRQKLKIKKTILLTMITTFGIKENVYSHELVANEITVSHLFS